MWITDLQVALAELLKIYELNCCIEKIEYHVITMTSGDRWLMDSNGHVSAI